MNHIKPYKIFENTFTKSMNESILDPILDEVKMILLEVEDIGLLTSVKNSYNLYGNSVMC